MYFLFFLFIFLHGQLKDHATKDPSALLPYPFSGFFGQLKDHKRTRKPRETRIYGQLKDHVF